MNCLLCEDRKADQTGSHVIPHFIIKSMVNEDSSGRDKEQILSIDKEAVNFSFGRSVLPETLRNTLGREITDQEIQNNEDPFTRDYIFCTKCEKKLASFESLYTDKVIPVIERQKELDDSQKRILYFFWLSVLLRCSIINFENFKLNQSLENSTKKVIDRILALSQEVIQANCEGQDIINKMIILSNNSPNDRSKNCVLLHPKKKSPYLAVINQFIVVFDYQEKQDIQQLENELSIELTSKSGDKVNTGNFDENERQNVIRYCNQLVAEQKILALRDKFTSKYKERYSKEAPGQLIQKFLNELVMDDSSGPIDKYNSKRVNELMEKYLFKT